MDYEERLLDYIDTLGVEFPIYSDTTSSESSISVASLPGSRTIQEYYDGVKEKEFIHEIQVKATQEERDKAMNTLATIGQALDDVEDIPSQGKAYDFDKINITNEVYFSQATTGGWIYFRLQIKSILTIY